MNENLLVKTGDILIKGEGDVAIPYEVIIADDKYFVVGNTDGSWTDFTDPKIYSNVASINDLTTLGFIKAERK